MSEDPVFDAQLGARQFQLSRRFINGFNTNNLVDVALLDCTFGSLWHQLAEQGSFEKRVFICLRWVEQKFPDNQPRDKYLNDFLLEMHRTDLNLTEIEYDCQFSDQSHFIKSFKSYTNMTPGEYQRSKSVVPGHVFQNDGDRTTPAWYRAGYYHNAA